MGLPPFAISSNEVFLTPEIGDMGGFTKFPNGGPTNFPSWGSTKSSKLVLAKSSKGANNSSIGVSKGKQ